MTWGQWAAVVAVLVLAVWALWVRRLLCGRRPARAGCPSEEARHALAQAQRSLADARRLGAAADELGRRADHIRVQWEATRARNHVAEAVVDSILRKAGRS